MIPPRALAASAAARATQTRLAARAAAPLAARPLRAAAHLLALLEAPEQRRHGAHVHGAADDVEDVVEDARDLEEHHADVLRAERHRDVEQLLDGHGVGVLARHHADVVEAVHVGQRLQVGLVLDQLLRAAVQQADVRVGLLDHLAVKLHDEAQHAVRRRVLRPEVQREALSRGACDGAGTGAAAERRQGAARDEARASARGRASARARGRGSEASVCGARRRRARHTLTASSATAASTPMHACTIFMLFDNRSKKKVKFWNFTHSF